MKDVLDSPWGRLFRNWETVVPDANGYPNVGTDAAQIEKVGGRAFVESMVSRHLHQGSAGVLEPPARHQRNSELMNAERAPRNRTARRGKKQEMTDFHIRSDNVDVEQIMGQIRARIREKRGVDYTEEEIKELANARLEKFLDPRGRAIGPDRAVPPQARGQSSTKFHVRRHHAVRDPSSVSAVHPPAAESDPETVLQPDAAVRGAAHPVETERAAGVAGAAALRSDAQPRRRNDPPRDRGEEPEDASRIDVEPSRFRRAARASARREWCNTGPVPFRRYSRRPDPAPVRHRRYRARSRSAGRAGDAAAAEKPVSALVRRDAPKPSITVKQRGFRARPPPPRVNPHGASARQAPPPPRVKHGASARLAPPPPRVRRSGRLSARRCRRLRPREGEGDRRAPPRVAAAANRTCSAEAAP